MGALSSLEQNCVEAASAEPMLAQVENWSAVNSGSRNLDGLGIIGARLAGAFADLPGEIRMLEPAFATRRWLDSYPMTSAAQQAQLITLLADAGL